MAGIRGLLIGVEGALVRLSACARHAPWEKRLGLPPGGLDYDVLESPSSRRACLGLCADADAWMELACLYRLHADEMAALARDFWGAMTVDPELRDYLVQQRSRLRVAGLANAWPGARERYMRGHGLADTLEELVLSAEEGLVKPDTRIYEVAAARLGLSPEHIIFVDTDPQHVAGARDAGLQALRFVATGQLIAEMTRLTFPEYESSAGQSSVTEQLVTT